MELDDDIYAQITVLSEEGDDLSEDGDFAGAIREWQLALGLLPQPKNQWEAATWLYVSIGEAYYFLDDYASASAVLLDELNCPDGQANPFVHYMLGKALVKLDDSKGLAQLLQAYMLDGDEIFNADEEEGMASLRMLRDNNKI